MTVMAGRNIESFDLTTTMWILYTLFVLAVGMPLLLWPHRVPPIISNIYNYGKLNVAAANEPLVIRMLRLNKWRCFTHLYAFATIYELLVIGVICWSYSSRQSPVLVVAMLDLIAGKNRTAVVEPAAVMVVAFLLLCQSVRRWYECKKISVFSDGKVLLLHYFLGVTFYWGVNNSLIARAPGFTRDGFSSDSFDDFHWKWHQLVGTVLYFWAAWHQHKSAVIFANLRKNAKGKVFTKQHRLAQGDWFEYVSCPHMLAEILVYMALNMILSFQNPLFVAMLMFVAANQMMIALLTHQWYLKTFKDYPKRRKAILPFLL